MKLVSMVDYILQKKGNAHIPDLDFHFTRRVKNYANFLNRPLEIGMFLPCDEEGNILQEVSKDWVYRKGLTSYEEKMRLQLFEMYNQAKERVLFEGKYNYVNVNGDFIIFNEHIQLYTYDMNNKDVTMQSLIPYDLTLTQSAIKQLK